jgi:PII-like signaling protein
MWCITIRIKRNGEYHGKRKRSTIHLEGISINMPLLLEVIDEKSKLEPLLPQIKRMVNDNGLVTLQEVEVL